MSRPGGNPLLKKYQFKKKNKISRNRFFSIAVEPDIAVMLKESNKELLRRAIVKSLIEQGFEIDPDILAAYNLL